MAVNLKSIREILDRILSHTKDSIRCELIGENGLEFDTVEDLSREIDRQSVMILGSNPDRVYTLFVNVTGDIIFLALGKPAQVNRGIALSPKGGRYEISSANLYTGEVFAIARRNNRWLTVYEGVKSG